MNYYKRRRATARAVLLACCIGALFVAACGSGSGAAKAPAAVQGRWRLAAEGPTLGELSTELNVFGYLTLNADGSFSEVWEEGEGGAGGRSGQGRARPWVGGPAGETRGREPIRDRGRVTYTSEGANQWHIEIIMDESTHPGAVLDVWRTATLFLRDSATIEVVHDAFHDEVGDFPGIAQRYGKDNSGEPGVVTGVVTNVITGATVGGATVTVEGNSATATSSSTGAYRLTGLALTGDVTITASATGFVDVSTTISIAAQRQADIALIPLTGVLTGAVTNASTGALVANATVAAAGRTSTTGPTGVYTLTGLPAAGEVELAASATGFVSWTQVVTGAVQGQTDIALVPLTGIATGVVTNRSTGAVIPNATVTAAAWGRTSTTGPDGVYTLTGLPEAGGIQLQASARGFFGEVITVTGAAHVETNIALIFGSEPPPPPPVD